MTRSEIEVAYRRARDELKEAYREQYSPEKMLELEKKFSQIFSRRKALLEKHREGE